MDERFEIHLRRGLVELIEPERGAYPDWATSPAGQRVGALAPDSSGAHWWDGLTAALLDAGTIARNGNRRLRLVVVLTLIALAVAAAGVVSVGSRWLAVAPVPPAPFACPPGTDPDRPGPSDQARFRSEYAGPVAFDHQSGRLIALSGESLTLWTFDVCTNIWHQSDVRLPNRPRAMAYDEVADLTVIFSDPVVAYDVETDSLTAKGPRPVGLDLHAVFRPATGQLVVRDDVASRLWSFGVVSDSWHEIEQRGDIPPGLNTGASPLAYDRSVDRLVLYVRAGDRTDGYEFDVGSSTWTRQPGNPPSLSLVFEDLGRHEVAYDEANHRTVLFSMGLVITYDPTARQWELAFDSDPELPRTAGDPTHRVGLAIAYDSVNERVISVGGNRRTTTDWVPVDDVLAFDLRTRTWIELLAQSADVP